MVDYKQLKTRHSNWYKNRYGVVHDKFRDISKLAEETGELARGTIRNDFENIKEEIADVAITLLSICDYHKVDLLELMQIKMGILEQRLENFNKERYGDKGTS